jgi:acyl carrier protein
MDQTAALVNGELVQQQDYTDTLEKIRDLLQERYGIEKNKVEMETVLESLGLDSLSLVEYAFDLEKSLNLTFSDLPHELVSVGDLVHYVDAVRRRAGT